VWFTVSLWDHQSTPIYYTHSDNNFEHLSAYQNDCFSLQQDSAAAPTTKLCELLSDATASRKKIRDISDTLLLNQTTRNFACGLEGVYEDRIKKKK